MLTEKFQQIYVQSVFQIEQRFPGPEYGILDDGYSNKNAEDLQDLHTFLSNTLSHYGKIVPTDLVHLDLHNQDRIRSCTAANITK